MDIRNRISASECLDELKSLIEDDIIGSIEANHRAGNITTEDAFKLRSYTQKLWEYLRKNYKELEVFKDMTDESFMTDIDLLCAEYEQRIMEGEARGNDLKLLSQICRKLQKGKTIDVIADELEEDEEYIEHICEVAERFAPKYDVEKIYEELHAVRV